MVENFESWMTLFKLMFVVICEKVQWFCLMCGINAKFSKKIAYSSQLINLPILGEAHRGVKGFVKDQAAQPIEGASMKVWN